MQVRKTAYSRARARRRGQWFVTLGVTSTLLLSVLAWSQAAPLSSLLSRSRVYKLLTGQSVNAPSQDPAAENLSLEGENAQTEAIAPSAEAVANLDQLYVGDLSFTALSDEAQGAPNQEWKPAEEPATAPTPAPAQPVIQTYTVKRGDTMGAIAARYGVSVSTLTQLNGLKNANSLAVGQVIRINSAPPRVPITFVGPSDKLVPDSEVVYGPAYKGFDIQAVANKYGGYLGKYREMVEGKMLTGPQIIQLVSERFSVGPRVLLTVLELKGGWVTQTNLTSLQAAYPMGYSNLRLAGLFDQASWVAIRLNAAYYLSVKHRLASITTYDGDSIRLASGLNAGSVAVQNVIARASSWDTFSKQITQGAFRQTYEKLFGDPFKYGVNLMPANAEQPVFAMPFADSETWWFTGGPHNAWTEGSPWAAIDLAPDSTRGSCRVSAEWARAIAPGKVVQAENGRIIVDLDGDGFQGTGWSLMYMHMSSKERVAVGTQVKVGDPIGHPSCEGGMSTGTHLHLARLYNGQWIEAGDSQMPMQLGAWTIQSGSSQYDGFARNGTEIVEACNCKEPEVNAISARPALLVSAKQTEPREQPPVMVAAPVAATTNSDQNPKSTTRSNPPPAANAAKPNTNPQPAASEKQ